MVTSENAGSGDPPRLMTPTAELQFAALWGALTELMGDAATATLVRRAQQRAARRSAALAGLTVSRDRFEYRYALPREWEAPSAESTASFCELMRELQPLLEELTGDVVIRRLRAMPELMACADAFGGGEP
jgi:hypothetical protein